MGRARPRFVVLPGGVAGGEPPVDGPSRRRQRGAARGPVRGRGTLEVCDEAGAWLAAGEGRVRATWGCAVLQHMARLSGSSSGSPSGPPCDTALPLPARGQRVEWLRWPDGRTTVERILPA
jgi:hypothetical protein